MTTQHPSPENDGKKRPTGNEEKGYPDNGRNRTEAVLEKAMPKAEQRLDKSREPAKPAR